MKNNILDKHSGPLIVKFICLWILFSFITIFFSNEIAQIFKPFINIVIEFLEPDFSSSVLLVPTEQGLIFRNEVVALQDIYRQEIPIAPKGSQFVAFTSVFHSIAPLSLIIASAFIVRLSIFSAIFCGILAVVFSIALILLTTPVILTSNIESQFYFAAINFSQRDLSSPLVMGWTVFIELGGQWLIAIIFSVGNLAISHHCRRK